MGLFFIGLIEFICLILLPAGIVWLIINLFRKRKKKKPVIIICLSILGLIILAIISDTFYREEMEQSRIERESRKAEEKSITIQKAVEESEHERQESIAASKSEETSAEATTIVQEDMLDQLYTEAETTAEEVIGEENETQEIAIEETSVLESQSLSDEERLVVSLKEIMPEETANKAYDIMINQIGFTNVTYIGKNAMGDTNFDFDSNEYKFMLTASDDVYRIFQPNGGAIFYEDGEVKNTVSDIENKAIDYHNRTAYYIIAQSIVEQGLKNPKSAKFPSIVTRPEEIAMSKNDDIIAVQSYVDAQNSFGVTIRSKWTVQYQIIDITTYSCIPLYLSVDNEIIYGEWSDME